MKIIHTSDWHLGKTLNDYPLIEDQRIWITHFTDKMKEICPDVILVAGDIYDRSVPPAEAVLLLHESIYRIQNELGCKIILTAGNHDSKERLGFGSEFMEQSGVYIVGKTTREIKKITLQDEYGPVNFYALPYCDVHTIKSLLSLETTLSLNEAFLSLCRNMLELLDLNERNVFIAHGFFAASNELISNEGTQVGGSELIDIRPFSPFDYIALGHIHSAKSTGLSHAHYSGSPLKYSVDEANHNKSVYEINLGKKGDMQISPLFVPALRDVRIISGKFSDLMNREYHCKETFNDYVFFHLSDSVPVIDAVSQLKSLFPNILGLRFDKLEHALPGHKQSIDIIEKQDTAELFSDFYRCYLDSEMTGYQKQTVDSILKRLEELKP